MSDSSNPGSSAAAEDVEAVIDDQSTTPPHGDELVVDAIEDQADGEASQLEAIASERDVYRETLQILQADFENYRKRSIKQAGETSARANENLVGKLLPVLDTIDLARAHTGGDAVDQIGAALLDVLTKEGLERIASVNEPFDPTQHEAVAHEPGDGESRVSEELRAGYRWKGRVIRPAMVKVIG